MREFVDQLLALVTHNPVLVVVGALLAFVTSASEIIQDIASPVLRDAFILLLCVVTAALLIRLYVCTARPSFKHARDKLNTNPWLYALKKTWGAFSITVLVLSAVAVAVAVPAQALAAHLAPPYTAAAQQIRLSATCRECPMVIDVLGRQTGAGCLTVDPGGVVTIDLDRWRDYRPKKIKAICTDGSSTEINLN